MWSFTGNASHTFGNESWKHLRNDRALTKIPPSIGINTGAWLLRQKKKIYGQANLTLVTPSYWLQGLARQSPVFEGKNIYQVFNGLDTSVFKPGDKQAAKIKLGLPPDRKTILFSSHFLTVNNPWKGGTDLLEILRRLDALATERISFLALGEGRLDDHKTQSLGNLDIHYMGYVSSETTMADCLSAADIFIYPTRADNLPNVLVESIACGTPAISFDIGGCGEIITHHYNGLLIRPFDHEAFAASIWALLEDGQKRASFGINGVTRAKENFQLSSMAGQYYTIFQKILSNRK
jgi:glycosyltransferase involved in cell wall biosynthesis